MGSNVHLEGGNAIADAALDLPSTDMGFLAHTDPEWEAEVRGSSANLDMIANAAALWWDRARTAFWVAVWLVFFQKELTAFQRSEPRSPIYSGWHLLPVLLVYRWAVRHGEVALGAAARAWLANFWAMVALCASTTQRAEPVVCLAGMRGTGSSLHANWSHRNAWREALGDTTWLNRGVSKPDKPDYWCDASVAALSDEIRFTASDAVHGYQTGQWKELVAVSPRFGARGVAHFYRTERGVVCWNESDINGNTGALMAFKCENGVLFSLPHDGGPHLRANSEAVCSLVGDEIRYFSPKLGTGVLALPAGEPLYHVRVDESGWTVLFPLAEVEPPPPPPPLVPIHRRAPKRNAFEKLLDFLWSLFRG